MYALTLRCHSALGHRVYISGKSLLPVLQLLSVTLLHLISKGSYCYKSDVAHLSVQHPNCSQTDGTHLTFRCCATKDLLDKLNFT